MVPSTALKTTDAAISVVPANEASWDDLKAVFGTRGRRQCQCQRYKLEPREAFAVSRRGFAPTACAGRPTAAIREAGTTSGLVAYLDGEPVGWCAVEPRTAYEVCCASTASPGWAAPRTRPTTSVWAVTCVLARAGYRRRGVSRASPAPRSTSPRQRGARALEGYPMITEPGQEITWGELHVGSRSIFAAAGFTEVSRPRRGGS